MPPDSSIPVPFSPRPSACPGLWRIVSALDGGICRVKLPGGQLSSAQARAVAAAARTCASGVLELTNRSNLQLRGVRVERQAELVGGLLAAGLGPRRAEADDVRNLLLSPAAGRDRAAQLDVRPLAGQLLDLLEDTPDFHRLSAKFALQLDGGEALAMLDHPHDLWLAAWPGGTRIAFGLAGGARRQALASVEPAQVPQLVETLLRLFLELAGAHTRMRELLAELPVAEFLDRLQARLPFALERAVPALPLADTAAAPLGVYVQAQPGLTMLLAGAPLGRVDAAQLDALAELAEREGSGELRLTPWQGVLLPDIPVARMAAVADALGEIGLLLDARAPLARLLACSGSSGCVKAHADTKADARRLAARLGEHGPAQVHLSGCPRSCAAAHVAPYTLLAQPGGRYHLYRREQGLAGFGRLLAPSLDIDQAGDWLAALPPSGAPA
ncbi:precorrin-3B synthase [Pseudomonas sp. GCM10022188]|uniref:precorrin-3B synthase n=1 Tax=Pseudomonas TaxID=286 RepID=UPI001E2F1D8A|nr:precorrin-3B synthase [Pseudomonas oryzagri]MCC6077157.1 precorrin-3B synthase [Pseudomonas oryzagri]